MTKTTRQLPLAGFDDPDVPMPSPEEGQLVPSPCVVEQAAESLLTAEAVESGPMVPEVAGDSTAPPFTLEGRTVYAVDANSLIYQVFHAMPEMSGPAGQPVGAIHGFTRDLLDLIEKQRPDYLLCAFDGRGDDNYRLQLFPDYKANRSAMPEDLRLQMPNVRRMTQALGIPCLECPRYEADDILATIARETAELGGVCFVVTADKDCRQLINAKVKLFNIRKNEVFDERAVEEHWGVRPDQVVDYQSLVGDPVDNVPGVPLVGPKLAAELLRKYGTLDAILDNAHEVNGQKRRENLVRFRDQALMSRSLVKLDDRVPLQVDWNAGRVGRVDRDTLEQLCREFGFRRLSDRVLAVAGVASPAGETTGGVSAPPRDYKTISDLDELRQLASALAGQPLVALDIQASSTSPRGAELIGCSFAWREGTACYVPVRAPAGQPQLDAGEVLRILQPVLEAEVPGKVGQNLKYAMVVLRNCGIAMRGVAFDTSVADYLLESGERNHSLADVVRRYLGDEPKLVADLVGSGARRQPLDSLPVDAVCQHAAAEADAVWRLGSLLAERLAEAGLTELFTQLEMPLIEVLADMEFHGISVDVARLAELSSRFGERLEVLQREIHELAGRPFNIDSRNQLADLLFQQLSLPVVKRTKTGPSTDVEVLEELARIHPLPAKIIEYRQHAKLKSTYVDALPQLVHPLTHRIHTSFKQDVAATGRLSSTDPNLQNIPVRSAEGREIRSAFRPGFPGWVLVCADYSQIELRVLAHFSEDEALQRAFAENRDIHRQVASEVFGVPQEEVTADMRRVAKVVNFGVIYGQTAFGLAKTLGIDAEEAARFIDAYFRQYAGVEAFMEKVLEDGRRSGYVSTILGRRRAVQGVRDPARSANSRQRNLPERIAINTVIQGSAADLIKQAMIQVHSRLRRDSHRARLLLQIHDELILETPSDELSSLVPLIIDEMSFAGRLKVPLQVDVKAGADWAACEKIA